jgi:hypothetical protein
VIRESFLPKTAIDWLSLGAAILFATMAMSLLLGSESAVLKLAVLDLPAWLATAVGALQFVCAVLLLSAQLRIRAAAILAILGCGQLLLDIVYRDVGAAYQSGAAIIVLAAVAWLEIRSRQSV